MTEFNEDDLKILKNHVSSVESNIYAIYNLPPEVVAVLFAYVSRSPASFRDNLLKLIKSKDLDMGELISSFSRMGMDYGQASEKARSFHEKWVVGYGHSSVAEHAVAHLALEDVSILASKVIEDNRLASYTEKSTRYQVFEPGRYHKPKAVMESGMSETYEQACDSLFNFYIESFPRVLEHMREKHKKPQDTPDKLYESLTKARACDVLRYVLPASTYTSIGMTANARNIEHMITKLLSHPLAEMNDIGSSVMEEVKKIIPTLVKYATRNSYIADTNKAATVLASEMVAGKEPDHSSPVMLVDHDPEAEEKLAASILYRYSDIPFEQARNIVASMGKEQMGKVIDEYMKRRGGHDQPMRELEHVNYTFDTIVDYGAFRDLQRHRICTQTNQELTMVHGYDVPEQLKEMGLDSDFTRQMETTKKAFESIKERFPFEAQYVVPLASRKRTMYTMNLRQLHHLISLRSRKEGHISYRRIAWLMHDEIAKVHPFLAKYINVDRSGRTIER